MSSAEQQVGTAGDWRGRDLGERTVGYTERDAILYALAIGAPQDDLSLVFEEQLRVLPTFALTLAQWAPDVLAKAKAFDTTRAVHGSQRLTVLKPLPRAGELTMRARVTDVWDKGTAAIFDVEVESDYFVATWSLFAPGSGGFGGERGPAREPASETEPTWSRKVSTSFNQAALYRLLGDLHRIHIDPAAAAAIGAPRPILHGLCTLAATIFVVAEQMGAHPADLTSLEGRFGAMMLPGDDLDVQVWDDGRFSAESTNGPVIAGGRSTFGATS